MHAFGITSALAAIVTLAAAQTSTTSAAASCTTSLSPGYPSPSVASGWQARIVAQRLTAPRGLIFDSAGGLLVVQQEKGIVRLTFAGNNSACPSTQQTDVIVDASLNHGIELSPDGRTLYASSTDALFAWDYDASTGRNTSAPRTLVTGMSNDNQSHLTRTITLSRKAPGMMLISRGSMGNLDTDAQVVSSGHSQIKAFNITNATQPYNYDSDGFRLGWGLRNSVGVVEHPITGGIYSVENSADDVMRNNVDIHLQNPAEEMNFHGTLLNNNYSRQGDNYGYPECFTAWNVSEIPSNAGIQTGTQFAIGNLNATLNDTTCSQRVAPALAFQAHMAPLDIKFNRNGTVAFVTMHGSWDTSPPAGYKLSVIAFANGSPVPPSNSTSGYTDIMYNGNISGCPGSCFRPAGLAFDSQGQLFMSSDSTGEIYVISRAGTNSTDGASPSNGAVPSSGSPSGSATPTGSAAAATSTRPSAAGKTYVGSYLALVVALVAVCWGM